MPIKKDASGLHTEAVVETKTISEMKQNANVLVVSGLYGIIQKH
jgi:preprotein translocase subunit YajC